MEFKVSRAVFFDFDGTLVDSAQDLVECANLQRLKRNKEPLPFEYLKNFVSRGTPAMLKEAIGLLKEDPDYDLIREEYLTDYRERLTQNIRFFDGIPEMLEDLDNKKIPWGIVTNKPSNLTIPLLNFLNLTNRVISSTYGDSAPKSKPHPDTIFLACEQASVNPSNCIYVGDDQRDIEAGKAAGMKTIILTYGYCPEPEMIPVWGADFIAHTPAEITVGIDKLFK